MRDEARRRAIAHTARLEAMGRGYPSAMLWLAKALVLALKTRRGRELLLAGGVGALDLARSKRARELYARAWEAAADPRPRRKAAGLVRSAAGKVRR